MPRRSCKRNYAGRWHVNARVCAALALCCTPVADLVRLVVVGHLCAAQVHSHRDENKLKGVAMLEALLPSAFTHEDKHECLYLIAVGLYRLRKLVDAKRVVTQALQEAPHSRQAEALRQLIDDAIMQDGLIGVGLVVGVAGLIGIGATAVASALSTSRRR
eukprot:scaffold3142_cov416-Prasinococcus_capsulatus_cf.AAC.1